MAKLSSRRRMLIYRTLYSMARSKVPVYDALVDIQKAHSRNGRRPKAVIAVFAHEVLVRLSSGMSGDRFAEAFEGWLPPTEISMLASAQKAGDIATGCDDAIKHIKRQARVRSAIVSAVSYPSVIVVMAIVLLTFVSFKVVPIYARGSDPATWTGQTAVVYWMSEIVRHYGIFILLGLVSVGYAIRWSLPNWTGRLRPAFECLPPWSTYKTMQGAVFFSNLAILLNAGADLLQTMVHIHKHANPWLQQRLQDTMYGLSMGKNLGVALELAGHKFPDEESIAYITTIASREGFAFALSEFATNSAETAAERLEASGKVFFYVGLISVTALAALIFFGLFGLQTAAMGDRAF
ncbi:type II secretion system F family protein [Achromobacter xylosoxidans]|nr:MULTISPECIES: type II secretion system F family protein [Achromobacter]SPT41698.1 Cholera toxin secretion protein epsF [Achromobacter denitrificans]MDH0735475.1 type II secretion system F family protein [Achromobacter spanius]NEV03680.1 hypothetical protein [Achromobacter xylosoxidans]QYJ21283.1 type II secretion system F family protein [Achromobacter sp. ES-001]RBP20900.1 type II secretion system (T2SS) protein F [Achromobacter marplatensis]